MEDFTQLYSIIYKRFSEIAESSVELKGNVSKLGLARYLDVSQGRMQHWEKGRWPNAKDCLAIADRLGFDLRWVVSGEGSPFGDGPQPEKVEQVDGNAGQKSFREENEHLTKALESERAEKNRLMTMNEQLMKEVLQFNQFLRERFGWDKEAEGEPIVFQYGLPDAAHATKKLVRGAGTPDKDTE